MSKAVHGVARLVFFCVLLLSAAYIAGSCGGGQQQQSENQQVEDVSDSVPVSKHALRAAEIADSMDIKLLAAQLILSAIPGKETVLDSIHQFLTVIPVGGITLFGYNLVPDPEKNRVFVEELFNYMSGITLPPFIASDQEGGTVQRIRGDAALPAPLTYWERLQTEEGVAADTVIAAVEREAAQAGRELRRIGVTLNLAPLAEALTENNRPFLKTRAYGPCPIFITNAAAAFIRGMEEAGIASTIKHFPGNSGVDPHYHTAILNVSDAELEEKVGPFRELIRREAPAAVMVSHVIVPSWDTLPLTRSSVAVERIRDMGFTGIIMADCFSMVATGAPPEVAVVEALAAGIDMVMTWPNTIQETYKAILGALEAGILSEERVRDAAKRIIYQKLRYELME
ncbi:MAG: hypothetical protein LBU70_10510 [Chitinispirillales bacterium]|jgi:beta-N-acetylhexosaminidase|nr:hypothetical protein [Chitinispirillales bacterium]